MQQKTLGTIPKDGIRSGKSLITQCIVLYLHWARDWNTLLTYLNLPHAEKNMFIYIFIYTFLVILLKKFQRINLTTPMLKGAALHYSLNIWNVFVLLSTATEKRVAAVFPGSSSCLKSCHLTTRAEYCLFYTLLIHF